MFAHRRGHFKLSINIDYRVTTIKSTSVDSDSMSPLVNTEDLLTATEVAEMLGLSHYNSVTTYLNRYESFPRPVVERSGGRIGSGCVKISRNGQRIAEDEVGIATSG